MLELLQKLWDEYALLVQAVEDADEDGDVSKAIADTDAMQKLRAELRNAGVKTTTDH